MSDSNTNAHSEGGGITNCQILRGPDADSRVSPAERHTPGRPGVRRAEGRAGELLSDALERQHPPINKGTDVTAVKMLPRRHPDRIRIAFDDHRLVANAGLILPATLALHLGLPQLVDRHLDLGDAPGRANPGDKISTLVTSALAGGDCIDDADVLRTGRTACALGCVVKAPSHPGRLPAQLQVGPRPSVGPGEPRAAGPGLAGGGRTRRRAIHHRP